MNDVNQPAAEPWPVSHTAGNAAGIATDDAVRLMAAGMGSEPEGEYDLRAPARVLFPVLTPLVNMLARTTGDFDVVHWKAITAFEQEPEIVALENPTQTIGLSYTVEANHLAGLGGDPRARAQAMAALLYQLKIVEERWILSATRQLLPPATPFVAGLQEWQMGETTSVDVVVTAANETGESLSSHPVRIHCRRNRDDSPDLSGLRLGLFPVAHAKFYNVYVHTGTDESLPYWRQMALSGKHAQQPRYGTAFTLPSGDQVNSGEVEPPILWLDLSGVAVTQGTTSQPPTTNTATTYPDEHGVSPMWDGLLSLALRAKSVVCAPSAEHHLLDLSDVETLLSDMYTQRGADPDYLLMPPLTHRRMTNLVLAANAESSDEGPGALVEQYRISHYRNKATGKEMRVVVDRYCPLDTLIAFSLSWPRPVPEMPNALEIEARRAYWGKEYRKDDSGYWVATYTDELLKLYWAGGVGLIRGIAPAV